MLNLFGLATGLSLVLPLVLAACTEPRQRQDWYVNVYVLKPLSRVTYVLKENIR